MTIQTFSLTGTIAFPLLPNSERIITIYDGAPRVDTKLVPANTIISANSFVKSLKSIATIKSVAPAQMPDFKIDDSTTDKTYKLLDVEWQSARKQVDMFIWSNSGNDWQRIFSFSLLNPMGYPFRNYNLLDAYTDSLALELGSDGKIGIAIKDVGFGLLTPLDEVSVYGSWVQEIVVAIPTPSPIYNFYGSSGSSSTPMPTPITDFSFNNSALVDNNFLVKN